MSGLIGGMAQTVEWLSFTGTALAATATALASIVYAVRQQRASRREKQLLLERLDTLERSTAGGERIVDPETDELPVAVGGVETEAEEVGDAPPDLTVPPDLVEAARHGSVLMIVGAAPEIREGAPSWHEFLVGTVNKVARQTSSLPTRQLSQRQFKRLLDRNADGTVVDLLEREMGRDALLGRISQAYARSRPSETLLRLYGALGRPGLISLALDPILSQLTGVPRGEVETARSSMNFESLVTSPQQVVLELAGDPERPGTVSLSIGQIRETLSAAPDLRSALLSMFASRTVVFVGVDVPDIEALWDSVGLYGPSSARHYALVFGDPDYELIAERLDTRYNVGLVDMRTRTGFADFTDAFVELCGERDDAPARDGPDQPSRPVTITRLELRNIGPFEHAELQFPSNWTVLLGNNGAGKSTILRALALALCGTDREAQPFARHLLRRGQKVGSIELTLATQPFETVCRVQLSLEGDRVNLTTGVSPLQAGTVSAFGFTAVRGFLDTPSPSPKVVTPEPRPRVSDVLPLLRGGLDTRSSDLKAWLRQTASILQDREVGADDRERAERMLSTFFGIVDDLAPGFKLRFSRLDQKSGELLLETSDGEIPLDYVSQGMSSTIGWLGTLLQRLYEINGGVANPQSAEAIVLIDEVDSHLHPEWQRRLVSTLRRTFPGIQVIATTHSALMVGSMEEGEVLKVSRSTTGLSVEPLEKSYRGYRVDQILTDAPFDLDTARDLEWEAMREEYAELLGLSDRTPAQNERYLELDSLMDQAPPPFELRAEREDYARSLDRVDAEIAAFIEEPQDAPATSSTYAADGTSAGIAEGQRRGGETA